MAETSHEALMKRHKQGWVVEVIDDLDVLAKARNKVVVEAAIAEVRAERDGQNKTGKTIIAPPR